MHPSIQSTSYAVVLCLCLLAPGCVRDEPPAAVTAFVLEEATITELQDAMVSGRASSRQLVELYLQRIEEMDRTGPALHSIAEVNPDALRIADELDAERRERGPRGPLHGVPVVVKDNIDTAGRMATTAGSLALEGSIAARDAFVVERLRAAGAVILAKTNLSEWANFRSTKSSSGWSALGGQVRNPYALDRSPCGSSSGSGVAVAANLAAAAVGTETDGSIVCPASATALVGIKPTVGLVSRAGIIPISHSQDTAGPMARTVKDAAILLTAMAGSDPRDSATAAADEHLKDFAAGLDGSALRGARIGVSRKAHFGYSRHSDRLAEAAIEAMRAQGAVIVDPVEIPTIDRIFQDCEMTVLLYEFKDGLNRYLAGLGPQARVRTLADLIAFNEREQEREMPYFGQELFEQAEAKGPLTSDEYRRSLESCRRWARTEGIDAVMREHRLDAIVAPTTSPPWPIDLLNGDHFTGDSSSVAAVAGYPAITVPAGQASGLPVGISFFGAAWSEAKLIQLAYAFEQATLHRKAPEMLTTISTP